MAKPEDLRETPGLQLVPTLVRDLLTDLAEEPFALLQENIQDLKAWGRPVKVGSMFSGCDLAFSVLACFMKQAVGCERS